MRSGRRCRRSRRRGCGICFDFDYGLPDGDSIALLYEDFGDGAAYGGGNLDNGFVGFELDDGLVFGECVADGDQYVDDVAVFDIFAQIGQGEFYRAC